MTAHSGSKFTTNLGNLSFFILYILDRIITGVKIFLKAKSSSFYTSTNSRETCIKYTLQLTKYFKECKCHQWLRVQGCKWLKTNRRAIYNSTSILFVTPASAVWSMLEAESTEQSWACVFSRLSVRAFSFLSSSALFTPALCCTFMLSECLVQLIPSNVHRSTHTQKQMQKHSHKYPQVHKAFGSHPKCEWMYESS